MPDEVVPLLTEVRIIETVHVKEPQIEIVSVGEQGPEGVQGLVGPQGPSGSIGIPGREVFTVVSDGELQFTLAFSPVAESVFVFLNGLAQIGFSVTGTTLMLDGDVITTAGDALLIMYQR